MGFCNRIYNLVVLWLICPYLGFCDERDSSCSEDPSKCQEMCSSGVSVNNELFLDTNTFLNTNQFCLCEIVMTDAIVVSPTNTDNASCSAILSLNNVQDATLKQFTCKTKDEITVEESTLYLKLTGIGTLRTCIHLSSGDDFNTTCYATGVLPAHLTTQSQSSSPTTTITTTTTTVSSNTTVTAYSNLSGTSRMTTVTVIKGDNTSPTQLQAGSVEQSFVLILTACVLGFLTLVAVVILIVCKCARHVKTVRQRERENSSYDITMSPAVQKISSRRLVDDDNVNDNELLTAENPLYERHSRVVAGSRRKKNPDVILTGNTRGDAATAHDSNPDGLIYVDLDHSEFKPNGKRLAKPETVDYTTVQIQKL